MRKRAEERRGGPHDRLCEMHDVGVDNICFFWILQGVSTLFTLKPTNVFTKRDLKTKPLNIHKSLSKVYETYKLISLNKESL